MNVNEKQLGSKIDVNKGPISNLGKQIYKNIFNCKCNFLVETFCSRMPLMMNKSEITFGLVLKYKSYFHIEIRDMYRRSPVKSPDIKTL